MHKADRLGIHIHKEDNLNQQSIGWGVVTPIRNSLNEFSVPTKAQALILVSLDPIMIWVVVEGNTCPSSKYIKPPETRLPSCESYANSFNSGRLNLLTLSSSKS